jgi:hypothetical protein
MRLSSAATESALPALFVLFCMSPMPHVPSHSWNVNFGLSALCLPLDHKRIERGADIFSEHVILAWILGLNLRVSMLTITLASRLSASRFIGAARDLLL